MEEGLTERYPCSNKHITLVNGPYVVILYALEKPAVEATEEPEIDMAQAS